MSERSERASAASEASGAFRNVREALRSKTVPRGFLQERQETEKRTALPVPCQIRFMIALSGLVLGPHEALRGNRVLKSIIRRFWRAFGAQVGAKLGPSWLKNGANFEKNRFFGGFDANFSFWTGFSREKVRFWRDFRPLGA